MISPEVQQALNTALQNHGRMAVNDPQRAEALVQEAAAENAREGNLLLAGLRAGVPQELVGGNTDGATLSQRLQTESFMAAEAADSAVQAWATALGVSLSASPAVEAPPVVAEPPVASVEPPIAAPTPPPAVAPPPAVVAPPPAAAPIAPPPAATQPAPPPAGPYAAPQPQAYQYAQAPVARKSNTGMIIAIVVLVLVIAVGAGGYMLYKKGKEAVDTLAAQSTTTGATTGTTPAGANTTGATASTPAGTTSTSADWDAYNDKLASFHTQYVGAFTELSKASTTATGDQKAQLDAMATAYTSLSQKLEALASDLDALTPPAEAAPVHDVLRKSVRDLSVTIGEGASAAQSHDASAFSANGTKFTGQATEMKNQLDSAVQAAGFDLDRFHTDGRLIKK